MKTRKTPVQIGLKDLPPEGSDFNFTKETGELNEALKEIIGQNPYFLKIKIVPQGNTFILEGDLKTALDLQCARCAGDFKQAIELKLRELIVIEPALRKNDQTSKANHAHEWDDSAPNYIILNSDGFDIGEYAHEAVALAEPIRPLCAPDLPEGCAHLDERIDRPWLSFEAETARKDGIGTNPFQILEKIKLKS